jgi:general nucleoside transport system permease protein
VTADPTGRPAGAPRPTDQQPDQGQPDQGQPDQDREPVWWQAVLRGLGPRRLAYRVGAPLVAFGLALLTTMVLLAAAGVNPFGAVASMLDYGTEPASLVAVANRASTYYLSAIAVAIGFRMSLFNIGVDGQYRLAAMLAASLGGAMSALALPAPLGQLVLIVVAMLVGGLWAAIAGLLRVTRGVSEVISTIMLNYVATGLIAYLLHPARLAENRPGSNNVATAPLGPSGQVGALDGLLRPLGIVPPAPLFGLILLAVAVGVTFHVVLTRTRFGFDLRAAGASPTAAAAAGVDNRRMILIAMAASGMVAGLVGMPELLGASHQYSLNFPPGLGFVGIAVALLGRNHPLGIAFAAALFAFLDSASDILQLNDVPKEIVGVMQGSVVLTVVIVYELVRRLEIRRSRRQVAAASSSVPPAAVVLA